MKRKLYVRSRSRYQRPYGYTQLPVVHTFQLPTKESDRWLDRTLTPHSEKQSTDRPSGAHSALTRPKKNGVRERDKKGNTGHLRPPSRYAHSIPHLGALGGGQHRVSHKRQGCIPSRKTSQHEIWVDRVNG